MNIVDSATDKILTVDEVAAYLGKESYFIHTLLAKKEIPAFKVTDNWQFRREEIEVWIQQKVKQKSNVEVGVDAGMANVQLEKILLDIVLDTKVKGQSREEITRTFFEDPQTIQNRSTLGIVETPLHIAKFIVEMAFEQWSKANNKKPEAYYEIDWFDPCSGSGVFAEAILELGFDSKKISKESELPKITIAEISPIGITASLNIIKILLERQQLSITEYISSGRLKIKLGDTLLTFPEKKNIFNVSAETFDIVVGNPPYVRSTNINKNYKIHLKKIFPSIYAGDADLYTYFIASGMLCLKPDGVLSFISPAGFIRAKNGNNLRKWLAVNTSIDTFYDLDETNTFPDADLHAAIYVIRKCVIQRAAVNYLLVSNNTKLKQLFNKYMPKGEAFIEQPNEHGWIFHKSISSRDSFARLFEQCLPLNEFGITVYSGIRPGLSEAFMVDNNKYNEFSDDIKHTWFKPLVLPSNIIRWQGSKELHYLLLIPSDTENIDQELFDYLQPFKSKLLQRSEAGNKTNWFNLRPCTYYNKMEEPKIVFPDLSAQQRFAISYDGRYVPDGAYFIDNSDLALLGILNSELARSYFINRCSSVGNLNSKGRFRFKKTFVQRFPLPKNYTSNGEIEREIVANVEQILNSGENSKVIRKINDLVQKLYNSGQ